ADTPANYILVYEPGVLTVGNELTANATAGIILCNKDHTDIVVTASGGTAPYTGTGTFNEGAGTYTYTISDANGCTATTTITLTEPTEVEPSASATPVLCYGDYTQISISATGGTPPYSGTGTFTVMAGSFNTTVTDANGCSGNTSITITEPMMLVASATATPISCSGGTSEVTVTATGGTAPYTGTGTFTVNAGSYSFTVTDANGCTTTATGIIMAPSAFSATANGSIACYGGTASVTVTAIGGTSPYTGTGTFTNVTAGNYTYTVSDANGCSTSTTIDLVEPAPISATISTINTTCNLSNGSATATVINGTAPYSYLWSPGGQTTSTITSLPEGNYSVAITDNNGCTGNASVLITNTSSAPDEPLAITGPSGACINQVGVVFSIAPVAGATSYLWTIPAGATGTSTSTSITLSFGSTYTGGVLTVQAVNSCGASFARTLNLTQYTLAPRTPGPITGTQNICGPQVSTYSVAPVANATSYTWSVLSIGGGTQAIILSGQGTNMVSISYPSGFIAGLISVRANNCIGSSGYRITYSLGVLIIPPIFTSAQTTAVCPGTTKSYEIFKFPNATSYTWNAPAGSIISNGFGLTGNPLTVDSAITKVYITYPAGFNSGTVTVYASNACGNGPSTTLNISSSIPATPGAITGPTVNLCKKTSQSYSISAVPNATSYTWTLPSGATFSGSSTGRTVTVNYGNSFTGTGTITVRANGICGSSAVSSITVSAAPAVPGAISGNSTVCKSNTNVSYSVSSVTGASSYTWTITGGATFVGSSTGRTVNVRFTSATASTAVISVRTNNTCGGSAFTSKTINVNLGCRTIGEEETIEEGIFNVYPNPASANINIEFDALTGEQFNIRLIDMYGKLILEEKDVKGEGLMKNNLNIESVINGVYILLLERDGIVVNKQTIVIEKN
ncbi:MAG: T9SS type A sorting domain-containing protein, partial [Bacteroidota bacterium]